MLAPRAARTASATAAASADAAAGVAAGAEGAACAAGVSLAPRATAPAAAGASGSASSSPRPTSHLYSQPAGSPVGRAPPRVPPPHLPPDLPATASEVQDVTSLSRVVTLLTTIIGKAVYDGKSVTTSNKRLIALAAEETRRAVAAFERLAPQPPPTPALAASTAAASGREAAAHATAPPTGTAAPDVCTLSAELAACVKEVRLLRGDLSAAAKATRSPTATAAPSYAQMAGRSAASPRGGRASPPPSPPPPSRPALVVTAKAAVKTRQEVVTAWRNSISFKNATYAPAKLTPISNNKLRVEFETDAQRDDALARLRGSEGVNAEPARKLQPMLILKGITKDTPSEDLIQIINRQNPALGVPEAGTELKLKFIRKNRNQNLYNAVLVAAPRAWRKVVELGRLNIDHQRVHAEEFSPFIQCRACLQFGHVQRHCASSAGRPCAFCADTAHEEAGCPARASKQTPRCFNCSKRNDKYSSKGSTAHAATSNSCPVLRAMKARVDQRIDYGCL